MSDRAVISKERWPPHSSAAGRQRLRVRFPDAPQQPPVQRQPTMEHPRAAFLSGPQSMSSLNPQRRLASFPSEASSNSRVVERASSWSASKAMDTGFHSKPQANRKRVRAEDLWDRDEEELLQRRASDLLAQAGEMGSQPESELPHDLHSFGGAGNDPLRSDLIGCEQDKNRVVNEELNRPRYREKTWDPTQRRIRRRKPRAVIREANSQATCAKFGSLPDNVQNILFGMLLQDPDPIELDTVELLAKK